MKVFNSLFVLAAVLTAASANAARVATADLNAPYQCAVTFTASTGTKLQAQLVVGKFTMKGIGNLRCVDVHKNTSVTPVEVTLGGNAVAARVALAYKLTVKGVATGVGFLASPADIFADYLTVGGNASVFAGGGVNGTVRSSQSNVTLGLSLAAAKGWGFNAGFTMLSIRPVPVQAPAPAPAK